MKVQAREYNSHRKFHRAFFRTTPQPITAPGRIDGVFTLSSVSPDTILSGAACAFLAHLEAQAALGRTSPHTVAARRYGLRFLGELERIRLADLRRSDVISWAGNLALTAGVVRRVPASLEFSAVRSLQALLRWCADRDACAVGVASRIATGYRPQPGRALTQQELDLMRAALAAHDRPSRCLATQVCVQLLRILAEDGARTAEVRLATAQNLDMQRGVLRWARGKNGLPRLVVLSDLSLALLKSRAAAARGGPLFANPLTGVVVTHHAVNKVVKRIAADAGLPEPQDFSPHDFRHTFATLAFDRGASLEDVAAALGHTSTAVTKTTYLHNAVSPGARRAHAAAHGRAA